MKAWVWRVVYAAIAAMVLGVAGGCMHPGQPLIADRSPVFTAPSKVDGVRIYKVRQGDTLYSIAWRFELPYRGLARANGIPSPYTIKPGQKLRLLTQLEPSQRVRETRARSKTSKPAQPAKRALTVKSAWRRPMNMKPGQEFGGGSSGHDYFLPPRGTAPIYAANAGEVVYAGNGIGGYERLIIIKHSQELLSAYSFDGTSGLAEKQTVKAGAKLADIKSRGRTQQSLHFELRRDGEPINPRSVLP